MATEVMDLFERTGAYLRGHFRLTSGLHSGEYLQCAKVLAHPAYAEFLGQRLAEKLHPLIPQLTVKTIVSPAIGGIIIGHEVARALNAQALFTERDGVSNEMTLRRGFEVAPGEPVAVIEDVITTGGSTRDVIENLQACGVKILAAGSIIDRSGGQADVTVHRVALATLQVAAHYPEQCPMCKLGIPAVKPGSRPA
jgi:orotate phosphoribosyltransferase